MWQIMFLVDMRVGDIIKGFSRPRYVFHFSSFIGKITCSIF